MPTPPHNPYIAGKALSGTRGFFGRDDVFDFVNTSLSLPDQNSVVLFGQRRIGKTSILLNLRSRLPSPPFVTVYFDLMDRARKSLPEVLYELAATIAQEVGLTPPSQTSLDSEGRAFREKFLPKVYAALGKQKRLVILFDEFDVLNVGQEEQLAANAAARTFFPYLRDLMTNEPRLGFVFVVGRKADDLGFEFKAAFKSSRYQRVSVLDEESARALILTAERDGLLRFESAALDRMLELTARHPYFTQLTCQLVFERAWQGAAAQDQALPVTSADIDAIIPKVLETGENVFEWIWDGLPPAEQVILSALAAETDEQTAITRERLESILQEQGIRILIRQLELAPEMLIEWEMLKQAPGGYKFFVELMRRWVVERKPLKKVKDQLDRIVPLADSLFQSGNAFFRHGMLDKAIAELQSALTINPAHVKARLLLGEIRRRQGRFDDAAREFEESYRIDKDSSRVPLENAYLQRADSFETQNQPDNALREYARVLVISPHNQTAKDRAAAIWIKRGEAALAADDLDRASAAFSAANAADKIAEVDRIRHQREVDKQAAQAEELERAGQWERASAAYQGLAETDRENPRWKERHDRTKLEDDIARRFTDGLGAMGQSKWAEAQQAFADVIHLRPEHQEAVDRMYQVTQLMRGEKALAAGNLAEARAAYQMAGAKDKLAEVDRLQRRRELESQALTSERLAQNRQRRQSPAAAPPRPVVRIPKFVPAALLIGAELIGISLICVVGVAVLLPAASKFLAQPTPTRTVVATLAPTKPPAATATPFPAQAPTIPSVPLPIATVIPTVYVAPTKVPTVPPTATPMPPTPTVFVPSATPPPSNTPAPVIPPGVYVTNLRVSPAPAKADQPMTFTATFLNTTGSTQTFRWRVEIWVRDVTTHNEITVDGKEPNLPAGENAFDAVPYKLGAGRYSACTDFRARVIAPDENKNFHPMLQPDRSILWLDFQICP